MKKEIAELWTAALRSGEYTQGTFFLKSTQQNKTKLCCLGVLCELAIKNGVNLDILKDYYGDAQVTVFDMNSKILSNKVKDWSGIKTNSANIVFDSRHTSLTILNDTGHTFNQIADIIDNNYEVL